MLLSLRHHLVRIGGLGGLHGFQVGHGRRVVGGLMSVGMRLVLSKKRLANLRVSSFRSQYQLVVCSRPSVFFRPRLWMSLRKISRPASLHGLADAEFLRCLDRIDGVTARIGEAEDLRLRVLRLQQEGREVRGVERMAHCADHRAALRLDHRGWCRLRARGRRRSRPSGRTSSCRRDRPPRRLCPWPAPPCRRRSERCTGVHCSLVSAEERRRC